MADNSIIQTIRDAEIDARSLSEFIYRPANFTVYRRLAPSIHTLDYYLNMLDVIGGNLEDRVEDVLSSMGFIIKGSFADGATLSTYNDALVDSSGVLYRWGGNLPKTVPAGSTPANTGGFSDNAWVAISNVDMTGIASGKTLNGGGAVLVDGATIYTDSYQKLSAIPSGKLKEGQVAKVRGTDFVRDGAKWKPAGRIYVNSWGARGDATERLNGTGTNSRQAFIEAAAYAKENGHTYIFAEAGIYYAPDLTCDEMQEVYVVGNEVYFTFTHAYNSNNGHAKILALSEFEYKNGVAWNSKNNSGQKGRIAFVFDDARASQFSTVPHVFKKYGLTYGIAWHTDTSRADLDTTAWIKESYRHGAEILAHTPNDIPCITLSNEELEQRAIADLDAIEAITGRRDNIHFVYPRHARDARTDAILSQFFLTGRGGPSNTIRANGQPGSWVCASMSFETGGEVAETQIKNTIKDVANSNGNLVFYGHDVFSTARIESLIEYALGLGVQICKPGQVKIEPSNTYAPYFRDTEDWTLESAVFNESVKSALGKRSIHISKEDIGYHSASFQSKTGVISNSTKEYAHYRMSFLYKTDKPIKSSGNFGLSFHTTYTLTSASQATSTGSVSSVTILKELPVADFDNRITIDVYVPQVVRFFSVGLKITNMIAPVDLYIDDFRFFKVAEVSTVVATAKVNEPVLINILGGLSHNAVTLEKDLRETYVGDLNLRPYGDGLTYYLTSSSAEDNGKMVNIIARPKYVYVNYGDV